MEAIVLAGGLGTRLRKTVPDLPKPLAPIGGKPFLSYLLDYWMSQGIDRFILSVGYKHEAVRDQFGSRYKNAEIHYSIETEPLGTGGGLLLSAKKLKSKEPFLLLNGDTFFAVNCVDLLNHHNQCGADVTLSLVEVSQDNRYGGVVLDQDGWVHSLESSEKPSQNHLANGGVYVLKQNFLEEYEDNMGVKCSLEDELLPEFLYRKKRIAGFLDKGIFIDIGLPQDFNRANEVLSQYGDIL